MSFFSEIGSFFKRFKKAPALEVQVSSAVNYLAPFVEELDDLVAPSSAASTDLVFDKLKQGLAALSVVIKDSSASGKANVASVLNSLASNAASLETAFQVKDPATATRATQVIKLVAGEVSAIQAQYATPAAS